MDDSPLALMKLMAPWYVKKGAALLDRAVPGWAHRIGAELEMASCQRCVLGQVYGGYFIGSDALATMDPIVDQSPEIYGFDLPRVLDSRDNFDPAGEYWERLAELWHAEVMARIEPPVVPIKADVPEHA